MIYSFLEVIHNILSQTFGNKAVISIDARPEVSNVPQIHLQLGKLKWGKTHLDVPTLTKDHLWTIRPYQQVVYINIFSKTYSEMQTTSAFLNTVLLTNTDEIIKATQKANTTILNENYEWSYTVKNLQWANQQNGIVSNVPFFARIKLNIFGDFKATKKLNMGIEIIKKINIIEN